MSRLLEQGIRLFNAGDFYESHEVLETEWTPVRGPRRFFLQSLIHFAVAFHHARHSNALGAQRQLQKGLRKLAAYLPQYEGLDTQALYCEGVHLLEGLLAGRLPDSFPQIRPASVSS